MSEVFLELCMRARTTTNLRIESQITGFDGCSGIFFDSSHDDGAFSVLSVRKTKRVQMHRKDLRLFFCRWGTGIYVLLSDADTNCVVGLFSRWQRVSLLMTGGEALPVGLRSFDFGWTHRPMLYVPLGAHFVHLVELVQ